MNKFPDVYHRACYHLVAFGAHGGDTTKGRQLCACALIALRHAFGRQAAQHHRRHMLFITGQFPIKANSYLDETTFTRRTIIRAS